MGTKEQHDEDMDMIIKTMSPEAKLKYLKQTGQGYPADEEMFLRAEPENTNEILFIEDILYGRVIYINNEWFLKEFTMEPIKRNYERF